ncbi:MAG: HIT family protein [Comamonadaceae bacterium]|nr:MAG: HIT family protein [Comamonadaceae bacterium]
MRIAGCELCEGAGGRVLFEGAKLRVIHAREEGFPAFYRVVWSDHASEFSMLSASDRVSCMEAVALVEQCLREHLGPAKINLASLGNVVAHMHWHVIARFQDDGRFPAPVWAPPSRERSPEREAAIESKLPALEDDLVLRLSKGGF